MALFPPNNNMEEYYGMGCIHWLSSNGYDMRPVSKDYIDTLLKDLAD